jgi:hypothetical protein
MTPQAFILPSSQIIAEKWDACVKESSNGLIYSTTVYLDAMTDNWHGVVIDDYSAVMAIPWRIKFGFRYSYMPPFMQQLGLTGDFNEPDLKAVIRTLPGFLKLADIHFNYSNAAVQQFATVTAKTNYVIDLSGSDDQIRTRYRKDLAENIRRAGGPEFVFGDGSIEEAVNMFRDHYSTQITNAGAEAYEKFLALCENLEARQQCIVKQITDGNGILAIALLLKDDRRIYNLMNTTTEKGRALNANDLLLDHVLQAFSGQPLLFDFEGSELPGVKAYYQKFGAEDQPYFHYHYNGLPWPLKLLKR